MIKISPDDAFALAIIAQWPNDKRNQQLVEELGWDAQRIGDILIGRAIPVMDKLAPHRTAAKELQAWAKNYK